MFHHFLKSEYCFIDLERQSDTSPDTSMIRALIRAFLLRYLLLGMFLCYLNQDFKRFSQDFLKLHHSVHSGDYLWSMILYGKKY